MSATSLARLERVIDTAEVVQEIETRLPIGVRRRQLSVRTLLIGVLLVCADHRPLHLRRVHTALTSLPAEHQLRLGVLAN